MTMRNLLWILFFATAFASAEDKGGFNPEAKAPNPQDQKSGYRAITDGQHQNMTSELPELADNAQVSMKGNLIKQSGNKEYLLRDEKGTVVVRIAEHLWKGQEVKPDDLVAIKGQLQRNPQHTVIVVSEIHRL